MCHPLSRELQKTICCQPYCGRSCGRHHESPGKQRCVPSSAALLCCLVRAPACSACMPSKHKEEKRCMLWLPLIRLLLRKDAPHAPASADAQASEERAMGVAEDGPVSAAPTGWHPLTQPLVWQACSHSASHPLRLPGLGKWDIAQGVKQLGAVLSSVSELVCKLFPVGWTAA